MTPTTEHDVYCGVAGTTNNNNGDGKDRWDG